MLLVAAVRTPDCHSAHVDERRDGLPARTCSSLRAAAGRPQVHAAQAMGQLVRVRCPPNQRRATTCRLSLTTAQAAVVRGSCGGHP